MEFLAELDVLDEDFLDVSAPLLDILINLVFNIVRNFLPLLKEILQDELATGIFQNGIGDLSDGCI